LSLITKIFGAQKVHTSTRRYRSGQCLVFQALIAKEFPDELFLAPQAPVANKLPVIPLVFCSFLRNHALAQVGYPDASLSSFAPACGGFAGQHVCDAP
jgi:hypothetical protein